ncbi:DUF125-domain-containing protein [Hypoxylon sp. NC1633]|nr:DUF125-domain-containing protein [Hypoxylon sp. NC1633]
MQVRHLQTFFARSGWRGEQDQDSLPAYSALSTDPKDLEGSPIHDETICEDTNLDSFRMDRQAVTLSRLPRFLSHFTMGFADGLTVPFALTAGLSSLGQTKTVIYAGMAEICAGCISMGISGYLAARGEKALEGEDHDRSEKMETVGQDSVQRYLAPLSLPPDLFENVKAHLDSHPIVIQALLSDLDLRAGDLAGQTKEFPPVVIGLSISFGYLLGGLLPLFPYFFVSKVDDGLRWSFAVCVLALFIFGFTKDYLLHPKSVEDNWEDEDTRREAGIWERIRRGCWEGVRMVIMGGIAAVAAVLCVKLFEDVVS